jgi:hypothetical protein
LGAQDLSGHHAQAAFAEVISYLPELKMQLLSTGGEGQTGTTDDLPEIIRTRHAHLGEVRPALSNAVLTLGKTRPSEWGPCFEHGGYS